MLIIPDAAITLLAYAYAVYGSHKRAKGIVIHKKRLLSCPPPPVRDTNIHGGLSFCWYIYKPIEVIESIDTTVENNGYQ